jgi:hypothetical protein
VRLFFSHIIQAISIQKPLRSLKTNGGNSFMAMFILESAATLDKTDATENWKNSHIRIDRLRVI